ncbi:hypothetical protein HJG52_16690 [Knoellia sp. DB2414S]|uniref:Uncharacterized protein n=1 Tax=Knoellia koreensis TaxID=2730921 RepID=A0A849HCK9_9MICO|nr:hypothetical protein [Knoellia sp. DB2414S]
MPVATEATGVPFHDPVLPTTFGGALTGVRFARAAATAPDAGTLPPR